MSSNQERKTYQIRVFYHMAIPLNRMDYRLVKYSAVCMLFLLGMLLWPTSGL